MTTQLAAGIAGLVLGCLVSLIWLSISAKLGQIDFWPSFRSLTRTLLCTVDSREFRVQYGQLLKLLAKYLARNMLLTAAVSLPVVLFVLYIAPLAGADDHHAEAGSAALLQFGGGLDGSFWSWAAGPEVLFYAGLVGASSVGILLFSKRSR